MKAARRQRADRAKYPCHDSPAETAAQASKALHVRLAAQADEISAVVQAIAKNDLVAQFEDLSASYFGDLYFSLLFAQEAEVTQVVVLVNRVAACIDELLGTNPLGFAVLLGVRWRQHTLSLTAGEALSDLDFDEAQRMLLRYGQASEGA